MTSIPPVNNGISGLTTWLKSQTKLAFPGRFEATMQALRVDHDDTILQLKEHDTAITALEDQMKAVMSRPF